MTTASQSRDVLGKIDLWLRMYRQMVSIREFEAQVNDLYTRALMPGLAHLYIGQEAVAVGVCVSRPRAHCADGSAEASRFLVAGSSLETSNKKPETGTWAAKQSRGSDCKEINNGSANLWALI